MKLNITRNCQEELYSKDEVESALNEFLIPMDEKFRKRSKEKQRILLNNPYYPGSYKYISKSLKNRNSASEWRYDIFTIYIPELLVSIPYSIVIYWIYLALMKSKSLAFVFFNVLLWFQMPMLRFFLALYRIKEIMLYFPLFTTVFLIGIILKQLQLFGVPESEIILYLRDLDLLVTWMALLLCGYFLLLILSKYTVSHEDALKRIQKRKRIKCNRAVDSSNKNERKAAIKEFNEYKEVTEGLFNYMVAALAEEELFKDFKKKNSYSIITGWPNNFKQDQWGYLTSISWNAFKYLTSRLNNIAEVDESNNNNSRNNRKNSNAKTIVIKRIEREKIYTIQDILIVLAKLIIIKQKPGLLPPPPNKSLFDPNVQINHIDTSKNNLRILITSIIEGVKKLRRQGKSAADIDRYKTI